MLQLKWIRSALPALALGAALAMPASATAQTPFPKVCALKDTVVITLIEEHGESGDLPGHELANASLTLLDARSVCAEGRVVEALALYQSVLELGPVTSGIRRAQR
jgi:hypothetical protein